MGAMLIANNRSGMAAWSSDARHWGELDCHGSICIAGGRGAEGGAARGQWRGGLLNFLTASRGRSRASETRPDRLGQAGRGPRCTPGHEYLTAPKHDQSPQWSSASPAGAFAGVLRNDSAQSSAFDSHVSGRHRAMGVGGRSPGRCW